MHLYTNKQLTMTIVLKRWTDVKPNQGLHVLVRYDEVMTRGIPQVGINW